MTTDNTGRFVFPEWVDRLRPVLGVVLLVVLPAYLVLLVWYGFSPRTIAVGYAPVQPVPYSHALHAGQLGIDCRYCHTTVEVAAHAAVPPTQTCMNCHAKIRAQSEKLLPVRRELRRPACRCRGCGSTTFPTTSTSTTAPTCGAASAASSATAASTRWTSSARSQPLSMGWCLDCHRSPEPHLRPAALVTKMDWVPGEDPEALGRRLRETQRINPSTDCSTCHR